MFGFWFGDVESDVADLGPHPYTPKQDTYYKFQRLPKTVKIILILF